MSPTLKRVLVILGIAIAAIVAVVLIYVIYVFNAYYRIDDNQTLQVQESQAASDESTAQLKAAVDEEYSVISYNVGFGAYSADYSFFMDGGTESRARSEQDVYTNIEGAMGVIAENDPQFALIQEVDIAGTRSLDVNELALVLDALPQLRYSVFAQNYDSPYLFYPPQEPIGANKSGIVTLSKFDITSTTRRSLPIEDGFMKLLDLDRCYSVSRIPLEDGHELVLYNMHLSAYTSDGKIAYEQLDMLFDDMAKELEAGNYIVAGGDFNKDLLGNSPEIFGVSGEDYTWAQPIPPEDIPADFTIVAPFDAEDLVASCRNADHPYDEESFRVTVDGFIISSNVQEISSEVIETGFAFSDHNPVKMSFKLIPAE